MAEGSALRELLAVFGIEVDPDHNLEKGHEQLESLQEKAQKVMKTLAEAFGVEKFAEFVKSQVEVNAHLQDLANRLDLSATEIRNFGLVAQGAGVDLEGAANSLGLFQKNLGDTNGGPAAATMAKLGVAAKDADGATRPLLDVLQDVADGIARLPDQNQRAAASMELFGRQGRMLLPILAKGGDAFREAMEEAAKLSDGLGDEFYANTKEAAEEFEHMSFAVQSLKNRALDAILPSVILLGEALKNGVTWLLEADKSSHIVQTAFVVLAGIIGVMLVDALATAGAALWALAAPLLATFAAPIAIATALVWVIQDLWNLMTGGPSVIGRVAESLGGVGAKTRLVKELRDVWDATRDAVNSFAFALGYALGVLAGAGKAIAGAGPIREFFLDVVDSVIAATRLLLGFVQAIEAIPKAIKEGSFEPVGKAIDKAGDAVFGKGGVFDMSNEGALGASSDVTQYGVPQSAVDLWNEHHKLDKNSTLTPGSGDYYGKAKKTGLRNVESRPILNHFTIPAVPGAGGGGAGVALHQMNHTEVKVTTASDRPKAVGDAVGAGVATANEKNMNNALAALVTP